ncbi:adenosine deaminase [Isoptericola sediminis]|uniref:adenosine deaminase n=1 Tax=Isoptericola sediminis TaxID=2733572 RepID=UPI0031B5B844
MSTVPGPAALPFAELHLHLEGTLEPDLVLELAARNAVELPFADVEDLRRAYAFSDLQSFLDLYYANMAVLRTPQDFADMTTAYLARAARAGVRHAEVMIDPQAHVARGVPLEAVLEGVDEALSTSERDHGVSTALFAAFLRDRPESEALDVLHHLLGLHAPIVGIGLDSAEAGHPPSDFARLYDRARAEGLHLIAHAGEEGPPQYVVEALDVLGVDRIDHGIRALEDDALVQRLVDEQVPLTVCPLSNVALRAVDRLEDHPVLAMLDRGLNVSVHSDDPAYFGGYLDDNLAALTTSLGMTAGQRARLAENSIRAAVLPADRRAALLAEISRQER